MKRIPIAFHSAYPDKKLNKGGHGVVTNVNEWTLGIKEQIITASAGVTVTQGSATGTLKTALTGAKMTSIIIVADAGTTFVAGVNVVVGGTTVKLADLLTVTSGDDGWEIDSGTDAWIHFVPCNEADHDSA